VQDAGVPVADRDVQVAVGPNWSMPALWFSHGFSIWRIVRAEPGSA
jgi:hypothetical protein